MFTLSALKNSDFSWDASLSLALASQLSYQKEDTIHSVAKDDWGFSECIFLNKSDTQCFIAETDDVVLVSFRGTESLGDWLGNINIFSENKDYGQVHQGFLNAYEVIHKELEQYLITEKNKQKKIWFTGHSLGGALASIAAAELYEKINIHNVQTFGQPRLGDASLTDFFETNYSNKFFRFCKF